MPVFCGERHLPGVFVKWVGNHGFINRVENSAALEAFAHFTYSITDGKLMVADIQGVMNGGAYVLT